MESYAFQIKAAFESPYTVPEVIIRLRKAAEASQGQFKVTKENKTWLTLLTRPGGMGYRNSFAPAVEIDLLSEGDRTGVSVSFALRKSVQIFMLVYTTVLLLAECGMLVLLVRGELAADGLVFLPIGFLLFMFLTYRAGLTVSSRYVLKWLRSVAGGSQA